METLSQLNLYTGQRFLLTSKHQKQQAIEPILKQQLAVDLDTIDLDTDLLGTFTGEIERKDDPILTAQKKCEWGLSVTGHSFGLASEGSFGPHPQIPFCAADYELLFFIDNINKIQLHVSVVSENTNYSYANVSSCEELLDFAQKAGFPSHGLILKNDSKVLVKGITEPQTLLTEFKKMQNGQRPLQVQTDMRAHMNPTRMSVIKEAAIKLADRLRTACPACNSPGWGAVTSIGGLPCNNCEEPTQLKKADIYGCPLCQHQETVLVKQQSVDSYYCLYCNP